MPFNKRQTAGRHENTRQQQIENDDQKQQTNNRFDALADEMIEDDITFHQSDTTDGDVTTNQQLTRTVEKTKTKITNSIGFHPNTNQSINFDFSCKFRHKKRHPGKFELFSPTLQLDEKQKQLYTVVHFKF